MTDNLESIVRRNYYKTYIYVYNNVSLASSVYQLIELLYKKKIMRNHKHKININNIITNNKLKLVTNK